MRTSGGDPHQRARTCLGHAEAYRHLSGLRRPQRLAGERGGDEAGTSASARLSAIRATGSIRADPATVTLRDAVGRCWA